jgi:small-conductance mechanosensitive channel
MQRLHGRSLASLLIGVGAFGVTIGLLISPLVEPLVRAGLG